MRRFMTIVAGLALCVGLTSAPSEAATGSGDELTIDTTYSNDSTQLSVNTFENREDRPQYSLTLTDIGTGAPVSMQSFGYASSLGCSTCSNEYETNWTTRTTAPLRVGSSYEAHLVVTRSAHYTCSIYSQRGCYWYDPGTLSRTWRFTWAGSKMLGTLYTPPAAVPAPAARPSAKCVAAKKALKKARKAQHAKSTSAHKQAVAKAKKKAKRVC